MLGVRVFLLAREHTIVELLITSGIICMPDHVECIIMSTGLPSRTTFIVYKK